MTTPKIATCCYCGTRAALVLRGTVRHELSCATCGAPLHDLKMLRTDRIGPPGPVKPSPVRGPQAARPERIRRKGSGKRRKGLGRKLLEEAWDLIEDVFD